MIRYGIVVHGGVGSPLRFSDGCKKACSSAFELLKKGSGALEAVVEAARLLEDDGRFTPAGIIGIAKTGCAIVSNRPMAHYALIH